MKYLVILGLYLIVSLGEGWAQVLLDEDFSTANISTPPSGWSQQIFAGDSLFDYWRFDNPGNRQSESPFEGQFAIFDSDYLSLTGGAEDVALISPVFNTTGLTNILLSFEHYFQGFPGSAYFVEVYNGTDWDTVLTGITSTTNPQHEILDITASTVGITNAQIRFRWEGDFSWFWMIDNVRIIAPVNSDVGVIAIENPTSTCSLDSSEIVFVRIKNYGLTSQFNFQVSYTVDGNPPITEWYQGAAIAPNTSDTFSFSTPALLNPGSFYKLKAYTSMPTDSLYYNDTLTHWLEVKNPASIPLTENFDTTTIGTLPLNLFTNATAQPLNFVAHSGPTSSINTGPVGDASVNGNGNYIYLEASGAVPGDSSVLTSTCIDLTNAIAPHFIFSRHLFGQDIDSMKIMVDHGVNVPILSLYGSELSANNSPWIIDTLDLTPFSGSVISIQIKAYVSGFKGDVALDRFTIKEILPVDIAVQEIILPEPACGLDSNESVQILLMNDGTDSIKGGIQVSYSVNGGTFSAPENITDTLAPGTSINYTFLQKADFSVPGPHQVIAAVHQNADPETANDTLTGTTVNIPHISSFPYFENFENGANGWKASGVNSSWALGTPAKQTIQGAASGQNAWVTGGIGLSLYNNLESSEVVSPCFDLSNAPDSSFISLDIWWSAEYNWDGAVLQATTDGGLNWENIGDFGATINWFNDSSIYAQPGGQRTGWSGRGSSGNGSGGWVNVWYPLDTTIIGQPDVTFRIAFASDQTIGDDGFAFDDFGIGAPPVQIWLGDTVEACIGDTVFAGVSGSFYSFQWSNGDTSHFTIMQNNTGADTLKKLWVKITNQLNLSSTDTLFALVRGSFPSVSVIIDNQVLCHGDANGQATALASGGTLSYIWDTNPVQDSATATGLGPGVYQVTVSDENNCAVKDSVEITEPAPLLSFLDGLMNNDCLGDSTGNIDITVSGGTQPYFFSWNNGDTSEDLTAITNGTYVSVITDANGCEITTDTFHIVAQDSLPVANFSFTQSGAQVTFINNSSFAPDYTWDFDDGNLSNQVNPIHTYQANNKYFVTLTATNNCGSSTFLDTVFMNTVGIEVEMYSPGVFIYPNPATDKFMLQMEGFHRGSAEISLFATDGKRVYQTMVGIQSSTMTHQVILPNKLPGGVYLLRILAREEAVFRRILVKK
jgi:PKD repeat protein